MVLDAKLVNFVVVKYKHAHLPSPTFYNVYPNGHVNQQLIEGVGSISDTPANKKLLAELRTAANIVFSSQTIQIIQEI